MRTSVGTSGHILIFTRLILKRTSVARAWSYFDIQNLRLVILYISDRFYISYFFVNHNGHAFDVDENYDALNIIIARKCLFLVKQQ
jgi:hypothetical protein